MFVLLCCMCHPSGLLCVCVCVHACPILQTCHGMEQYSIKAFAEALEVLPRALAENAGVKVSLTTPAKQG